MFYSLIKQMQSEHAHHDLNYSIHTEPRVSSETHIKQVALAALSKVPGAKQVIENTFDRGKWKKPFTLPGKRHMNQAMHLGWG